MRRNMTVTPLIILTCLMVAPAGVQAKGEPSRSKSESAKEAVKDTSESVAEEMSDSWLTMKTKMALLADERISSMDVKVTTEKSVVTLRGKVDSQEVRQAAEEVARGIDGVKQVKNELTVVPKAARKSVDRQDDQIVKDVEKRLKQDARLKDVSIVVQADKGVVTLTGKAPTLEKSYRASQITHQVSGVRAVRNNVTLERKG